MRVFISYRREDSGGQAGWIYDKLTARYSPDSIFMDVARIEPGADFTEAIGKAVGVCDVMLVVIGRKWLGAADPAGQRRIDDPGDFVRLEIVAGLSRNIPIVCVLVDGSSQPARDTLPRQLVELARARAARLRESSWDEDIEALAALLDGGGAQAVGAPEPSRKRWGPWFVGIAVLAGILAVIAGLMSSRTDRAHDTAANGVVRAQRVVNASATVKVLQPRALAILPDARVACASANGIVVVDTRSAASVPVALAPANEPMSLAVLSGNRLAWGTRGGSIEVWDLAKRELDVTLNGHTGAVIALAPISEARLASAAWDGTIRLWNLANGKSERTLTGHTSQVRALAGLGNDRLASGSMDGTIILWNLAGAIDRSKTLNRSGAGVTALALLPEDRLVAGTESGSMEIWNGASGNLETNLLAHRDWINALAILPRGLLAAASDDGTISVWDPSKRSVEWRLVGHGGRVNAIAVLRDDRLVSASDDGTVRVWSLR